MPDKLLPQIEEEVINEFEELENTFIGIVDEEGTIRMTSYQLSNIHEFLKAFYQPNINEPSKLF